MGKHQIAEPMRQELAASCDCKFADPALAILRKLGAERLLERAILLLMYRESYRL